MANDIVNLATFEFDTVRLEKSLESLQTTMFALKKEQQGYNDISKESQKAINALTAENIKLAASGKENSKAYKDNTETIKGLNAVQEQNYKNSQNVANNMSRVRVEIGATNNQLQAYMNTEGAQISLIDAGNKALQTQVTNINQARASNTELLRVRNQLNPLIASEAKLINYLNGKLNENNAFIKENASEYEKQKINVGNYTESIKDALSQLGGFNGSLGNAGKALSIVTPLFSDLKKEASDAFNQIKGGTVATEGLTAAQTASAVATNVASGSLKLLRIALISTGIGAIVVLLGSFVAYLTTTQAGIDKVTAATRPLQAIFQSLLGVIQVLGEKISNVFSNPKKAINDLANLIKENLINRFTALGDIIDGIINLDFDKVAESTVQAVTGVDNLAGKVKSAAKETAAFLAAAAAKGSEIDRLNKEIEKDQLKFNANQIAVNDALDEQLLISKDTSRNFAEREAASREIIRLSKQQGEEEAKIIQKKIEVLKLQQSLNDTSREGNQELIDLQVQLDAAKDRGIEAEKEQIRVIAGARKEQQEAAKKAAEERLKAQQAELDFYIASQGTRKKSMQEQLDIDRETARQSLEIAKAELKAKKLTQTEYNTEVLRINQELASKQAELAIENANLEYDLFIMNNQRKVKDGEFFSNELYTQELARINLIAEAEAAQQTLKYEKGLINAAEYAVAIAKIDADQQAKNDEAAAERETAIKEKQVADLAVQDELNAQRFEYDSALALERFDIQAAAEIEALKKKGGDIVELEKLQAKKRELIERTVQNNKLELASQAFGNIASLLGESSAAGKAAAIATTTIDTYLGAQKAYTSQLIPGDPTSVPRAILAAAVSVVSGLANVKRITSVKTDGGKSQKKPSYARGVIGIDGVGTSTSDNIDAKLSVGESVINARSTAMFPNLLSSINQAGGGVDFNGNLSNSVLQNEISSRADNSQMASMIAEAVAIGAERGTASGSKKGIRDLSTDRKIEQNAIF